MKELGELIRAARDGKGLSIEQAAAETRIRRSYLEAMEDGDFRIFPGSAYATGFLRNYATYLGLNPDEILQTYHVMAPPPGISITPATTVGAERMKRRSRRRTMWTLASVGVVVLCGFAIKEHNDLNQVPQAGNGNHPRATATLPSLQTHPNRDSGDQAPHGLVQSQAVIHVKALDTAWVRITKNGHQVYWGPVQAGTSKKWHGHKLKIATHHSSAFKVWVDGTRAWRFSHVSGRVRIVATPFSWHRIH